MGRFHLPKADFIAKRFHTEGISLRRSRYATVPIKCFGIRVGRDVSTRRNSIKFQIKQKRLRIVFFVAVYPFSDILFCSARRGRRALRFYLRRMALINFAMSQTGRRERRPLRV